ncbi:MAG: DEAD/DEAH box helicase [Magnetococcales bacterium]|nr:DEAD/DEAH box helicase [Magnetococcales bacterium]
MTLSQNKFSYGKLIRQLTQRATAASLGLKGFRHDPLRAFVGERLQQNPGETDAFLADPVFETTFGWQPAERTLRQLQGKLLHPELVEALRKPCKDKNGLDGDYIFPERPYHHQLQAWQALIAAQPPRSVLVSSGTGSGKTECFLVPVLHDLAAESAAQKGSPLVGVRALFLYPLNALIKSQKDRLVAWSEPFKGQIRFCLYNGNTPEDCKPEWLCEVADRKTLRNKPPPMLITNSTMLEYMLVRNEDQPIINQSQGTLRWIIIDEAHTYLGSQAAELTLLLRRVLHAFACRAEEVHFVATSATLGNGSEDSTNHLRHFLANIAGVSEEQVDIIEGSRAVPELPFLLHDATGNGLPGDLSGKTAQECFTALAGNARLRYLRQFLVERPRRLGELMDRMGASRAETLAWLDLATQAKDDDGNCFLPLRGHLFQRTINGLWACVNPACPGAKPAQPWPFGSLYFGRHEQCPYCHYPVFEMVQCGGCGKEYLVAMEQAKGNRKSVLQQHRYDMDEDEFQQELEPLEEDETGEGEPFRQEAVELQGMLRLLPIDTRSSSGTGVRSAKNREQTIFMTAGGEVHWSAREESVSLLLLMSENCSLCGYQRSATRLRPFQPIRVGAPFLLGTAIPTLLDAMPPKNNGRDPLPLQGKRLITFTDSRQGTARASAKLQQEVERDYVRSLLYYKLSAVQVAVPEDDRNRLEEAIVKLQPLAEADATFKQLLAEKKQQLAALLSPPPASLSWGKAEECLLENGNDFTRWLVPGFKELTMGALDQDRDIARLCLYRDFLLRPKRKFSMEGLGLIQLKYPGLNRVKLPEIMRQYQVTLAEWQDLLQVCVDFHLRGGKSVSIANHYTKWLGYRYYSREQLSPDFRQPRKNIFQRLWPAAGKAWSNNVLFVRLVAHAFSLDPSGEDQSQSERLNEILLAVWEGVKTILSRATDGEGWKLDLQQHANLVEVREAWFCPVTRRLLPVTFRGLTPYLPAFPADMALATCQKVTMPRMPATSWSASEAEEWLAEEPQVRVLRAMGAWIDLSDRIVRFRHYLRAVEHSAQIDGNNLTTREKLFKEGKINLLSCSTTMEMGVDIGGLTGVAMNNVPPHPANFLQRSGRAGRRGETASISFTLCKGTPHGEAVFYNPLWPFVSRLAMPQVALQSGSIVQRHVNALALTAFLRTLHCETIRFKVGHFFESDGSEISAPADRFVVWCREEPPAPLAEGLAVLTRRTLFAGRAPDELLGQTAYQMERVLEWWLNKRDRLLEQQENVKTRSADSKAELAIAIQLKRLRGEYLLGELATVAFLPGYGFPTDVVPFVNVTLNDLRKTKEWREDNRSSYNGYPSRNLAIAIRDYAPGSDTVVDGRVYRSDGITLNWQLPAAAEAMPEIQDLRWIWRCRECGNNGTRHTMPEQCPHCTGELDIREKFIRPAGFAVDLYYESHNDVETPQYIPVRDPFISLLGAEWMALPMGRYRSSSQGRIFHYSTGVSGKKHYYICLYCGRACNDKQQLESHRRLRGGREHASEKTCPGNSRNWAIQTLWLGAEVSTEIFELQLQNVNGSVVDDKKAIYTIAVALRRALCRHLGIEEAELGVASLPSRARDATATHSLYVYDMATGGAGYAGQLAMLLPELLPGCVTLLVCPKECDTACQACLLGYDTQHHSDLLDRQAALAILSEQFVHSFSLPGALQVFGTATRLELEPLHMAINRCMQAMEISEIRIHLGGEPVLWEPLDWRLWNELKRWSAISGVHIQFVTSATKIEGLANSQKDALAAVLLLTRAELYCVSASELSYNSSMMRAVEIGNSKKRIRWAGNTESALIPGPYWGSSDNSTARVVRLGEECSLEALTGAERVAPDALRSVPSGWFTVLDIHHELNGQSVTFGDRVWQLLTSRVRELSQLLHRELPLSSVTYTDRYLRSPLSLVLLHRLCVALSDYSGGILPGQTKVLIVTSELECLSTGLPSLPFHDWHDAQDRRHVVEEWFLESLGDQFRWIERAKRDMPHDRELTLTWTDGKCWAIRLDQGVGYWRFSTMVKPFPFDRVCAEQVKYLHNFTAEIVACDQHHPTRWYCGQRVQNLEE